MPGNQAPVTWKLETETSGRAESKDTDSELRRAATAADWAPTIVKLGGLICGKPVAFRTGF